MGKTPVQTVHADFPHTAYQVVVRVVALCSPRIVHRPAQAVESQSFEEGATPRAGRTSAKAAPGSTDEQGVQPVFDVAVHRQEFGRRITRTKILAPSAEHGIHVRDDAPDILTESRPLGQVSHASTHPPHGAW